MAGANRWTAALLAVALALGMAPTAVRPAPAAAVGRADTFKVEATRELLIGGTTSNGMVVESDSNFVALPNCTNRSCPWLEPGVRHALWGLRTEYGARCYVRLVRPDTGRCAVAPVDDVGPWFRNDDYWKPTRERNLNLRPQNPADLPRGVPAADRADDGADVGYGTDGTHGRNDAGDPVPIGPGIDLGEQTWANLGFSLATGNDYAWDAAANRPMKLSVTLLWLAGEDPAAADRACRGTQAIADLPSAGVIAGDVLRVTSSSGVNLRTAPGRDHPTKGVIPYDGRAIASGKRATVDGERWREVRARLGNGWVLASAVTETTAAGLPNRTLNPTADGSLDHIAANAAGTALSRVTIDANARVKTVVSGTYGNQGPRYASAAGLNVAGPRAYVGVAQVVCVVPVRLAQVTVKAWYTDGTSSAYATAPALVVPSGKTVHHLNFYVLTGGARRAAAFYVDNAHVYEL